MNIPEQRHPEAYGEFRGWSVTMVDLCFEMWWWFMSGMLVTKVQERAASEQRSRRRILEIPE